MNKIRIITLALAIILTFSALVACDGKNDTTKTEATSTLETTGRSEVNSNNTEPTETETETETETDVETRAETEAKGDNEPSEGLEFVSNGNGTCYVKSAGTFTGDYLVIPSHSPDGDKVTKLGESSFSRRENIKAVFIPNTVNTIGERAFEYCTSLSQITIEETSTLYRIEESAFINCLNLTQITLPKSLIAIEEEAFLACYRLVEINNYSKLEISRSNKNGHVGYYSINVLTDANRESGLVEKDGFLFCRSIDSGIYFLVSYSGNESEVTLPSDINGELYHIQDYAFYRRNDITKLTVNSGAVEIGSYAFSTCKSLKEIDFSNSDKLTTIGMSAFAKCESLESLSFHKNLISIYQLAFTDCKNLKTVSFAEGSSFYGFGAETFKGCSRLEEITIPASTRRIGAFAFSNCRALVTAIFENTEGWHMINSSQIIPPEYLSNSKEAVSLLKGLNYSLNRDDN